MISWCLLHLALNPEVFLYYVSLVFGRRFRSGSQTQLPKGVQATENRGNMMVHYFKIKTWHSIPQVQQQLLVEVQREGICNEKVGRRAAYPYLHAVIREQHRLTPAMPISVMKQNGRALERTFGHWEDGKTK